ncbi:MAG: BLUF domain-containing protein [Pseudomonadota bacterium]|nr:BLUF domain-containing protein [Pseudomonadota bacterium]
MSKTNSDRLFHLGYVSTETGDLGSAGMVELLTEARRINTSRDITGLLLHRDRSFYQVLEGAEDVVRQTFHSIEKDERHTAIDVLFEGEVDEREFPDWQMGFLNLDGVEIETLQGYSDFLSCEDNAKDFLENLSRGKRLALMFRSME